MNSMASTPEGQDDVYMFQYEEKVRLKEAVPELNLRKGAPGVVHAFYKGSGYEITFYDSAGWTFSTIMLEEQLEKLIED